MKEHERKMVVDRVSDNLKLVNVLEESKIEFNELSRDDKIKRYLELKDDIELLEDYQKSFNNDINKMINYEFFWAFNTREKGYGFSECKHDIWYYVGSFYDNYYAYGYDNVEDLDGFEYNDYVCLECGKLVHIEDYVEFEKTHTVLKDREDLDYKKYMEFYYQMLYQHSIPEAQGLLVQEFNKNKEANVLKRKK